MRLVLSCLAPFMLGGLFNLAAAQRLPTAALGTRVRITMRDGSSFRVTGTLVSLSADSLAIARSPTDTFRISRHSLAQLESSRGRRPNAARGALYGLLGGAVLGAIPGAIWGFDTGDYVETGTLGALSGLALGTLVGAALRTKRWAPAELDAAGREPLIAEVFPAEASVVRVRLTAPAMGVHKLVGSLVALRTDTLLVRDGTGETIAIPRSAVTRLWLSDGHRANTGRGALYGFVAGILAGGVWALAAGSNQHWHCGEGDDCSILLVLPAAGAAGGAAAGALVGAFVVTERWKLGSPAELRLTLQPARDTGTTIRLLLSLNAF